MIRRIIAALLCAATLIAPAAWAQSLSPAQITTLRAAVFADPTAAALLAAGNPSGLRDYLNASGGATAWATSANVGNLLDAVAWVNYTPNDAVAGADTDPLLTRKIGWLLTIQVKQMNLQLMLQGRDTINCARPNVRAGLRDAVVQVPSGANGAYTSPGGANGSTLLANCTRPASRAEVVFAQPAQGSDTTGATTARVLTWEGAVSDVESVKLVYRDNGSIWTP